MARVEAEEVQQIVGDEVDTEVVDALIEDASAWVDAHLVGVGLGEAALTSIEKYLAAHLTALVAEGGEGQLIASARADISERYAERSREHGETSFIQAAAAFDRTGFVREHWIGGKRVQFRVGDGYAFRGVGG